VAATITVFVFGGGTSLHQKTTTAQPTTTNNKQKQNKAKTNKTKTYFASYLIFHLF